VDRICTLQVRPVLQKITLELYKAARRTQGEPLTLLAARRIVASVKEGDKVVILSGNGHPSSLPAGETDGPVGAAALARALVLGVGAVPVIVSEKEYLRPIVEPCKVAGLVFDGKNAAAEEFPLNESQAQVSAERILRSHEPTIVIAIEKLGSNAKGVRHNMKGEEKNSSNARADYLIEGAKDRKIPTIGIGDGGNELGLGMIYNDVRRIVKTGAKCVCPCGDGIATATASDVLAIGAASNWGAYGIEAVLSLLTSKRGVMHDSVLEANMLAACVGAGGRDGPSGKRILSVDGSDVHVQRNVVQSLGTLVENAIRS
jgi:hypothetical protein